MLVNAAYSNILTRTEAVNMTRITTFCSDYPQAGGVYPNAVLDADGNVACNSQSLRRHRLALRARPGEFLAGGLRPHAHRRGAHAAVRERRQEPADDADRRLLQVRESVAGAQRQHQLAGRRGLRYAGVGAVQRTRHAADHVATSPSATNGMLDSGVIGQPADVAGFYEGTNAAEHQSRFRGAGPALREWRRGLRWPVYHGIQREQRGAHLRPRRADAGFLVQREVGHHRGSAHAVRRAVHQGATPATTTSWWPPTVSRRWTTRPTAMARR